MNLRLKQLRKALRYNQRDFAAKIGVHLQTLSRYERGEFAPSSALLDAISRQFNANLNWLISGEGPMFNAGDFRHIINEGRPEYAAASDGLYRIPVYRAGTVTVKDGAVTGEIADHIGFSKKWIGKALRADPADLFIIRVSGDSMNPSFYERDLIVCSKKQAVSKEDGIYLLVLDGAPSIKRLQFLPGEMVKVASDNKLYESFTARESELVIAGRIVWFGRAVH
jgi:phage repressor protein C with HTH and peptisase S24 domain